MTPSPKPPQPTPTQSMADPKNLIVILGGSYGGISTAHYLLKHVTPHLPSHKVILASTSSEALCRPACPRALLSDDYFPQTKLFVDIAAQFAHYPPEIFEFVHGTATDLDAALHTVTISLADTTAAATVTLTYHALIIATGALAVSPLLGLNSDDAPALRAAWAAFRARLPSAKHIVIAGGGPSGVEVAGEIGEHLNGVRSWWWPGAKQAAYPRVAITLVADSPTVLPQLRPVLGRAAQGYLARVGVDVVCGTRVVASAPAADGGWDVKLSRGDTLHADEYIPCVGTAANTSFVREGDKARLLAADGRVRTDPGTLRTEVKGVYAVGDVSDFARPAIHNVLAAVPVLCANVRRDLVRLQGGNDGGDRLFVEEKREMQLVPVGWSKGVGAMMGFRVPSVVVWLIKGRDYWLWTTGGLWSGRQWAKA
ncbi:hypothetical protein B0T22DRAFT_472310 [Podospora appendiculata]|uniref:FAD/NAD(P)-binding domain-containing protein n=1 Tax=Podospora appendiculata TaxID=314037 RepID=A0AAE1C8N4_9PEZI|nr:hypothetical protein B0T22DRAFT_472310 [Podospora appendiculata]